MTSQPGDTVRVGDGRVHLLFGPVSPGQLDTTAADVTWQGATTDGISRPRESSDLDLDGYADVLVFDWMNDGLANDCGASFLLSGGPALTNVSLEEAATVTIFGTGAGMFLPNHLAAGDVDGDGAAELLVGDVDADGNGTDNGCVFGFWGLVPAGVYDETDAQFQICGGASFDNVSQMAFPGDMNADGLDDFAVSGSGVDNGALSRAGGIFFFFQ